MDEEVESERANRANRNSAANLKMPELADGARGPGVSIATHVSDKIDSILELLPARNVTAVARSIANR